MVIKLVRLIFLVIMATSLWYCANVVAPKGGPKDEIPPQLVMENSSPNLQTNFTKQDIVFEFDEWVELNDVFNQIIISPPIEKKDYEVKIKGKSIVFHFKESAELRQNATYTINFGEAVRDITERNPAKNLRYVFSTGNYIDSLTVSGKLIDAKTNEPVEDAFFMLYEHLADSVVRTQNPFYFGRADASGNFLVQNVRAGTFKGFAIKRVDQNYKYDNPAELIGFPDDLIIVGDTTGMVVDSSGRQMLKPVIVPPVRLFLEMQPIYISDVDSSRYGYLNLTFNRPLTGVNLHYKGLNTENDSPPYEVYEKDSLHIWFDQVDDIDWQLFVQKDSILNDTINVPARNKEDYLQKGRLFYISKLSTPKGKFSPFFPIKAGFSQPLVSFDTSFIHLLEDTTLQMVQPDFSIDSLNRRKLLVSFNWKELTPYELEILPGGVEDMFGLKNRDTISLKYISDLKKSFGNIEIKLSGLNDSLAYLGELLDKNNVLIKAFKMKEMENFEIQIKALPPGDYHIKIITDLNDNGEWDTGNYDAKRQAEPIFEKTLDQLRANWDVEVEIDFETK